MTIFVDNQGHLMSSECVEELHTFAKRLQLKPEWFQDHPRHPHYDLTTRRMIQKAMRLGAQLVSPKVIVTLFRNQNPDGGDAV